MAPLGIPTRRDALQSARRGRDYAAEVPTAIPDFVAPSGATTALFVALCVAVVAAVGWGVARSGGSGRRAAIAGGGWLLLTAALSATLRPGDASAMAYFGGCNLAAVALAGSPVGRRLATLPLRDLVGFHAFRLPLELLLHAWVVGGTLPPQMTWTGRNLDVVTGVLAALAWLRPAVTRAQAAVFEVIGLGLLLNVMATAARSAPTPLRTYLVDPPVLLPYHVPTSWIVSVCVAGALAGHLVLARALLAGRRP